MPGGYYCRGEGTVEGAQVVVSRGQADGVEALANTSHSTKGKDRQGVNWIEWNGMEWNVMNKEVMRSSRQEMDSSIFAFRCAILPTNIHSVHRSVSL